LKRPPLRLLLAGGGIQQNLKRRIETSAAIHAAMYSTRPTTRISREGLKLNRLPLILDEQTKRGISREGLKRYHSRGVYHYRGWLCESQEKD